MEVPTCLVLYRPSPRGPSPCGDPGDGNLSLEFRSLLTDFEIVVKAFISRSGKNEAQCCTWVSPRGYPRRAELKELAFWKGTAMTGVLGKEAFFMQALTFLEDNLRGGNRAIQHLFTMLWCSFLQVFVRDAFGWETSKMLRYWDTEEGTFLVLWMERVLARDWRENGAAQ